VPQTYADYRELLAVPEIDLVSICLPNYLHCEATIAALRAGKHVLVEKPMALSALEAESMLRTANECGKTLAVSMNYRWSFGPDSWYLKDLIARGNLGDVYYIRSVSLRRRTFLRGQVTWFTQKELSGGAALIDMGPHMLDLAMWLADDYAPVHVSGVTRTAIMVDTDVDDFATALIRLKGGATIALESAWEAYTHPQIGIAVMGTRGGAILNMKAPPGERLTIYGADGNTLLESTPVDIQLAHAPESSIQEHVLNSIRAGREPDTRAELGLAIMRVIDAIYESSATGRGIAIAQVAGAS
jgi:predicted dehydrogenase